MLVVTVIVAVPGATAVTTPFLTLATAVLSDFHFTFLLVASSGITVAFKVYVFPTLKVFFVLLSFTPVTGRITLILQVPTAPPIAVAVADIVAFPTPTPVTFPVFETLATDVLLEVHVTVLSGASVGYTVAFNFTFFPTPIVAFVLSNTHPFVNTCIVYVAKLPLTANALIVVVPSPTAVIFPASSTVATAGLSER